tara:strand:+ start:347 stop:538 length:192 start_codon:yes stop_codon:yes gene_type:complete
MLSNLFFLWAGITSALPVWEDGSRDISLWASSCKKNSSWKGHKKNPDGEIKKPSGLYLEVVTT